MRSGCIVVRAGAVVRNRIGHVKRLIGGGVVHGGQDWLVLLLVVRVFDVVHGRVRLLDVVSGVRLLDVVRLGRLVMHDRCLVVHGSCLMVHCLLVMHWCAMMHNWSFVMLHDWSRVVSWSSVMRHSVVQDW